MPKTLEIVTLKTSRGMGGVLPSPVDYRSLSKLLGLQRGKRTFSEFLVVNMLPPATIFAIFV